MATPRTTGTSTSTSEQRITTMAQRTEVWTQLISYVEGRKFIY